MIRAVGAMHKAVTSVEMAVPPTMVAGELSVECRDQRVSEGETSGDDFSDGEFLRTSTNNHTEWLKPREEWDNAGKRSSKNVYIHHTTYFTLTALTVSRLAE